MFNQQFFEDASIPAHDASIDWEAFRNKSIYITGGTGLIGTTLIYALDYANNMHQLGMKIVALVRDQKKAEQRFSEIKSSDFLSFSVGNVELLPQIKGEIDYIIHGASQTTSKEFVDHAVETIQTSVLGTINVLQLAKEKRSKGFVYLSSMEVYGFPQRGHMVDESEIGMLTPLDPRNSYPISKIMSEALCCAYASEYHVPAKIVRLTQTFGPGVAENDTRIFAYFAKCIRDQQDIILKTKGETERSYLYAIDAVTAIITVLLKGETGRAYNAANEETYCSIAQMAENIASSNGLQVKFEIQDEKGNGFPQTLYMNLDTGELRNLGWKPSGGDNLAEMFRRTAEGLIIA